MTDSLPHAVSATSFYCETAGPASESTSSTNCTLQYSTMRAEMTETEKLWSLSGFTSNNIGSSLPGIGTGLIFRELEHRGSIESTTHM